MKVESALTLPSPGQTLVLGSETLQFGGAEQSKLLRGERKEGRCEGSDG